MKSLMALMPILVGSCIVAQGMFNKNIASVWKMSSVVLLNMSISLLLSCGFFLYQRYAAPVASAFPEFKWWFLLPGIFGFLVVTLTPLAIAELGAFRVFLVTVTTQLLLSIAVDSVVHRIPLTWGRIIGAGLSIAGVFLANS
jgi:transporter family-2 protein